MTEKLRPNETQTTRYLMTYTTFSALEERLVEKQRLLYQAGKDAGEAAGQSSDWHDNNSYDEAVRVGNILSWDVARLTRLTTNAQLIEARTETGVVDIGNRVVLTFAGESTQDEFHILGPEDATLAPDKVISCDSPLGRALRGTRAGSEVGFAVQGHPTSVFLHAILPGDFNNPPEDFLRIQPQ